MADRVESNARRAGYGRHAGPVEAVDAVYNRPTSTAEKVERAKHAAMSDIHPNREIVVLTQAKCLTCGESARRFVTNFGLMTVISEWAHDRGNPHPVQLGVM